MWIFYRKFKTKSATVDNGSVTLGKTLIYRGQVYNSSREKRMSETIVLNPHKLDLAYIRRGPPVYFFNVVSNAGLIDS